LGGAEGSCGKNARVEVRHEMTKTRFTRIQKRKSQGVNRHESCLASTTGGEKRQKDTYQNGKDPKWKEDHCTYTGVTHTNTKVPILFMASLFT